MLRQFYLHFPSLVSLTKYIFCKMLTIPIRCAHKSKFMSLTLSPFNTLYIFLSIQILHYIAYFIYLFIYFRWIFHYYYYYFFFFFFFSTFVFNFVLFCSSFCGFFTWFIIDSAHSFACGRSETVYLRFFTALCFCLCLCLPLFSNMSEGTCARSTKRPCNAHINICVCLWVCVNMDKQNRNRLTDTFT